MDIQKINVRLTQLKQALEQTVAQYNATLGRIAELEEFKKIIEIEGEDKTSVLECEEVIV